MIYKVVGNDKSPAKATAAEDGGLGPLPESKMKAPSMGIDQEVEVAVMAEWNIKCHESLIGIRQTII